MFKRNMLAASVTFAAASLMVACGGSSSSGSSAIVDTVDIDAVKENYVTMAAAVYEDSYDAVVNLRDAINVFTANPTEANLEAARDAYKLTRKPYQQSEIYRWDTVALVSEGDDLEADGGLASVDDWEGQVNAWPLDENKIEFIINQEGTYGAITPELLVDENGTDASGTSDEANVTTGVHAIEFMLWDRDSLSKGAGERAATEFGADADCNTPTGTACRNSAYLKAASDLLVADLDAMRAEWVVDDTDGDTNLAEHFLASDEAFGYILQSIASMAVGELGGARLSAGLWRPAETQPTNILKEGAYEEEHDCFSDLSHYAVYYNFQGILNAFQGTYTRTDGSVVGSTEDSFGELVKSFDRQSFTELTDQLTDIQTNMKIVFDAGEDGSKTFDDIIADSESAYESPGNRVRSDELIAVEAAITGLSKVEEITKDIAEAESIVGFDSSETGETD